MPIMDLDEDAELEAELASLGAFARGYTQVEVLEDDGLDAEIAELEASTGIPPPSC